MVGKFVKCELDHSSHFSPRLWPSDASPYRMCDGRLLEYRGFHRDPSNRQTSFCYEDLYTGELVRITSRDRASLSAMIGISEMEVLAWASTLE